MSAMAPFDAAWADPDAAGRAAAQRGEKVVGYLTNGAPVELIAAAGLFPMMLSGDAGEATLLTDRYMEPTFDPIVRSVFQRLLAGRYDFLSAILLPRSTDSVQRLYYYLCELRRDPKNAHLPEPLLFDLQQTQNPSSGAYDVAAVERLAARLCAISGKALAPLAETVRHTDLARLCERRRAKAISGSDALKVFKAARVLPGEAFHSALEALLATPEAASPGRPVVVAGSALDQTTLHDLIEGAGGCVVGDYHGLGEHLIGDPPATDLSGLARRYQSGIVTHRSFPRAPAATVAFAKSAGAEGVIYFYYAEEEALTWDFPAERRALEAAGIAVLLLENQPYLIDAAALKPAVSAFIATLGQGRAA